jgi:hypothetical protein
MSDDSNKPGATSVPADAARWTATDPQGEGCAEPPIPFGSTGSPAPFQASKPPRSAKARVWPKFLRSESATRALEPSFGQVQ